jgi:hypothetical protein
MTLLLYGWAKKPDVIRLLQPALRGVEDGLGHVGKAQCKPP